MGGMKTRNRRRGDEGDRHDEFQPDRTYEGDQEVPDGERHRRCEHAHDDSAGNAGAAAG